MHKKNAAVWTREQTWDKSWRIGLPLLGGWAAGHFLDGIVYAMIHVSASLLLGVAGALGGLAWAFWPYSRIRGKVRYFNDLDARDLTPAEFTELEQIFRDDSGALQFRYLVHLEIDNPGSPTRAKDWHFTASRKSDLPVEFSVDKNQWSVPALWPRLDYTTLARVQSEYLAHKKVYHVVFQVVAPLAEISKRGLDKTSFQATFRDSRGRLVVCKQVAD
jgi:hypothetical protein